MLDKIKEISDSVSEKISRITSLNELGDLRVSYLGKNGEITALLKGLKNFSAEERPVVG
ncbi:MAG: phenylalanine--tRNA ligase subunit alpha, partial [Clostridia bacterium]|nr:phenylalanine--tRNA ligase subunit alpha [Clostridia bacterium]